MIIATIDSVVGMKPIISQRLLGGNSPNFIFISAHVPAMLSVIFVCVALL